MTMSLSCLDTQTSFDQDWANKTITYAGWNENASSTGVMAFKLLSQNDSSEKIDRSKVRSLKAHFQKDWRHGTHEVETKARAPPNHPITERAPAFDSFSPFWKVGSSFSAIEFCGRKRFHTDDVALQRSVLCLCLVDAFALKFRTK